MTFLNMKKKKQVAIHAELRKESQTFDGWLKYEVTLKDEKGRIEKVPAYGKDLQDALSRVVHDSKVKVIEDQVVNKIPDNGWVLAWFLGLSLVTSFVYYNNHSKWTGWYVIGSMAVYVFVTLAVLNWFKLRNQSK